MVLPHGRRNIKIEIVGDFVIFLITFLGRSGNQDIFFLVQWKMGLPHRVSVLGLQQIGPPSLILVLSLGLPKRDFTQVSVTSRKTPS